MTKETTHPGRWSRAVTCLTAFGAVALGCGNAVPIGAVDRPFGETDGSVGADVDSDVLGDVALDAPPEAGDDADAAETHGSPVGSACTTLDTCLLLPGGRECRNSFSFPGLGTVSLPGGFCTAECDLGSGTTSCGDGSACVGAVGLSWCLATCSGDADCRFAEGYRCRASPVSGDPNRYCVP